MDIEALAKKKAERAAPAAKKKGYDDVEISDIGDDDDVKKPDEKKKNKTKDGETKTKSEASKPTEKKEKSKKESVNKSKMEEKPISDRKIEPTQTSGDGASTGGTPTANGEKTATKPPVASQVLAVPKQVPAVQPPKEEIKKKGGCCTLL